MAGVLDGRVDVLAGFFSGVFLLGIGGRIV